MKTALRIQLPLLLLLYAALCWIVFTPMMQALHGHWITANDLDAGYLLLLVALYVLWQTGTSGITRDTMTSPVQSANGLLAIAGLGLVGIIALAGLTAITANKSVTLALLVLGFLPFSVWVMGIRVADGVLRAVAILLMATPVWFVLVPELQALTARAVNWLLSRGSWPIYIEGNLIALPSGMLEIAAGCAGLKFLQTALALTLIEGFVARRSWFAMALIGIGCALLAMLSNWLRVTVVTLLALYLDPGHPWVADHNWVGWVIFALMFGPLFYWLGNVTRGTLASSASATHAATTLSAGGRKLARAAGAAAIAFAGAAWLMNSVESSASVATGQTQLAAARALCLPETGQHPAPANFPGAQITLDCPLSDGYYLSLRGFLQEAQEREVINPVNQLVPGVGLLEYAVSAARRSAAAPGIYQVPVSNRMWVAYGFYATGEWTAAPGQFKWRSLARPFVPGPVFALVVTEWPDRSGNMPAAAIGSADGSSNDSADGSSEPNQLRDQFQRVAEAIRR